MTMIIRNLLIDKQWKLWINRVFHTFFGLLQIPIKYSECTWENVILSRKYTLDVELLEYKNGIEKMTS